MNENKRKVAMLLHYGRDYIWDIDNAVPKVEGYDATIEYLNKHLNPKPMTLLNYISFKKQSQIAMK